MIKSHIKEIVLTDNGRWSLTRTASAVAMLVSTWIVIHMTLNDKMTWEMFLAYMGTTGGFSQVSKWMAYRYGVKVPESPEQTPSMAQPSKEVEVEKCGKSSAPTKQAEYDEGSG